MEGNKRGREESAPHSRVPGERDSEDQTGTAGLVFEDPFEDEFEEEDIEQDYDEDEGQGEEEDEEGMGEDEMMARVEVDPTDQVRVFRQGIDPVPAGEELEYDPSAYVMYHSLRAEWPCLSFDVMRDSGGDNRVRFPLSMYIVCGSQADTRDKNKVTILKLSEMHKTYANADSDNDEEDDDNLDEDPVIDHVNINHSGGVNRIRSMPQNPGVIATMADTGFANIFDASAAYQALMGKGPRNAPSKPAFTFKGHSEEGFAIDWSPVKAGRLATGDCAGSIHVWEAKGGSWQVDSTAYRGHTASVEDLQWSPVEESVFCSCAADKTLRVWDVRGRAGPQISLNAHESDVNVISWNRGVSYLLASGADDGSFKVWDLRALRESSPVAHFKHHTQAVTSIEWAPNDDSSLAVSGADDQVTVWDLSVEAEESEGPSDYPPQLLFIHQGQKNVKELHFHPQLPGVIVTTAEDGLNVFKPAINVST